MANIPNARRYRSTGTNRDEARVAGNTIGSQQYQGRANHHAGACAAQDKPHGNAGSPGWLIATVLVSVGLIIKFPIPALGICLIALAVKFLFGKG